METNFFYISKKGLKKMKSEYDNLKKIMRTRIAEDVHRPSDFENINFEYFSLGEDLSMFEKRRAEIKNYLERAVVLKKPKTSKKAAVVAPGATVVLQVNGKDKKELTIVGTPEINPSEGLISNESPVGRSLLGRKLNDEIIIRNDVYKIKGINYNSLLWN